MTTILLLCVFGVSKLNPGTLETFVLTGPEISKLEHAAAILDLDMNAPELRSDRALLCREHFGKRADLSWTEERQSMPGVEL